MDLAEARRQFPLVTEAGLQNLTRIREHALAPRWTHAIGDHVTAGDLQAVDAFRRELAAARPAPRRGPPEDLVERVAQLRERVPLWLERIPQGFAIGRDWAFLPTTRREDLAAQLALSVPEDEPQDRLIVYETSGTTGHALRVPQHPRAVAKLHALAERALGWHGCHVSEGPDGVACMNLHAQAHLWVYPSLFSVWREAGFARLNLNANAWPGGLESPRQGTARGAPSGRSIRLERAGRFIEALSPGFVSGDPRSFCELLRLDCAVRPAALLSTAVALAPSLRAKLEARFGCPVLDWYSTTETGPIACSKPGAEGLAVLSHDLYVEVVDAEGLPIGEGERGEIVVSGGRNPFLPLLRYRTGDFARLVWAEGAPWLVDLEGRAAVAFRAADGSPVNPVDVGRTLRQSFAVLQHEFVQRADGSCEAALRTAYGLPVDPATVARELQALFGESTRVEVRIDPTLGLERKAVPYRSELPLEET